MRPARGHSMTALLVLAALALLALGFVAGAVWEGCRPGGSLDTRKALRALAAEPPVEVVLDELRENLAAVRA